MLYIVSVLLVVMFVSYGCGKKDTEDAGAKGGQADTPAVCAKCLAATVKCACGMAADSKVSLDVDGKTVYFCGETCKAAFKADDPAMKDAAIAEAAKYKCSCKK